MGLALAAKRGRFDADVLATEALSPLQESLVAQRIGRTQIYCKGGRPENPIRGECLPRYWGGKCTAPERGIAAIWRRTTARGTGGAPSLAGA
jgi:hypothetical protein